MATGVIRVKFKWCRWLGHMPFPIVVPLEPSLYLQLFRDNRPPKPVRAHTHTHTPRHTKTHAASDFYPRDSMLARVIAIATCPSVRLSVTRRYCVKMKKASVMISSLPSNPKILVFWRQISSPNSKRPPPPNWGLKQGWGGKIQRSTSISRNGSR